MTRPRSARPTAGRTAPLRSAPLRSAAHALLSVGLLASAVAAPAVAAPAVAAPGAGSTHVASRQAVVAQNTRSAALVVHASADGRPTAGVRFDVSRVDGVDLGTVAGWDAVTTLSGDPAAVRARLGSTVTTAPTGADGSTRLSGLPIGLYLVHNARVLRPDGSVDDSATVPRDMLVTLPTRDEATASWLFDVDVHPKPDPTTITKSVADGHASTGRVLTYTLDSSLPSQPRTGYTVVDDLTSVTVPGTRRPSSDFLEFTAADWTGEVTVATVTGGTVSVLTVCPPTPTPSCDYVLQRSPARVSVEITDHGRQALQRAEDASAGSLLRVTAQARVRPAADTAATRQSAAQLGGAVPSQVLTLPNRALLLPNGGSGTGVSSNTTTTTFATAKLHKIDEADGRPLAGAQFTLYRSRPDATAGRNPVAVSEPTDAAGMTQFAGIQVSDIRNGAPAQDRWWLVETRAPRGYVRRTEPVVLRLLADGSTLGADSTLGLPIRNRIDADGSSSTTGPGGGSSTTGRDGGGLTGLLRRTGITKLPRTGADSGLLLAVAGGLVGTGVGLLVYRRRRGSDA